MFANVGDLQLIEQNLFELNLRSNQLNLEGHDKIDSQPLFAQVFQIHILDPEYVVAFGSRMIWRGRLVPAPSSQTKRLIHFKNLLFENLYLK